MRFFSSRQIVTMVVAVCATIVLMPSVVWAASTSLVRITDGSGRVAQVDSHGRLVVTSGGAVLPVSGRVGVAGKVGVTGTVSNRPILPGTPFHKEVVFTAGDTTAPVIFSSSSGVQLYITSLTVSENAEENVRMDPQAVGLLIPRAGGSCTSIGSTQPDQISVVTSSTSSSTLTFPTPVVFGAAKGTLACVVGLPSVPVAANSDGSRDQVTFGVTGYTN